MNSIDNRRRSLERRAAAGDNQARRRLLDEDLRAGAISPLERLEQMWSLGRNDIDILTQLLAERRLQGVERDYQALDVIPYADAIAALRGAILDGAAPFQPTYVNQEGEEVARGQSAAEVMDICLEDFYTFTNPDGSKRSFDDRLALLDVWKASVTGVANKAGEEYCKIIPISHDLITVTPEQVTLKHDYVLQVAFDDLPGEALPTTLQHGDGTPMANQRQTKEQTYHNAYWLAAADHDEGRLRAYTDIVHAGLQHTKKKRNWKYDGKAMKFWCYKETSADQLRALWVHDLGDGSDAVGSNLSSGARLFRVARKESP